MSAGKYRKEHNCLNCGRHVEKHYCSDCGQPNLELKENFWQFITHSIAHYFHFDNKFFQTLKPLLTQPGQVTLDYLAGKRARYINPVNMYIFVSIVYFLVVPHALEKNEEYEYTTEQTAGKDKLQRHRDINKELDKDLTGVIPNVAKEAIKDEISKIEFKKLTYIEQKQFIDSLVLQNEKTKSRSMDKIIRNLKAINTVRGDSTYESYLARQKSLPQDEQDNWFEKQVKKKEITISSKTNHGEFNLKAELKKYQPKQYFLLMPLLAFFIMLNFRKNHIYYLDHLIFTVHGMTAFFIISIVTQPLKKYVFGLDSTISEIIGLAVFAGIVWYLYKGLKLFYNRTHKVTIRKTITLMFLYYISLSLTEWLLTLFITYVLV